MKFIKFLLLMTLIFSCNQKQEDLSKSDYVTRRHLVLGDYVYDTYQNYHSYFNNGVQGNTREIEDSLSKDEWERLSLNFEAANKKEIRELGKAEREFEEHPLVKKVNKHTTKGYTMKDAFKFYKEASGEQVEKLEIVKSDMIGSWKYQYWQLVSSANVLTSPKIQKKDSFNMYLSIIKDQEYYESIMVAYSFKDVPLELVKDYYLLRSQMMGNKEDVIRRYHLFMRTEMLSNLNKALRSTKEYKMANEFNSIVKRATASADEDNINI
ncbi:hypothetical protein [Halobacteriovorax sp. ZH2_bin.1]|uniref:hypothetical protein n=1 Tax=unclassified Halobacteriovorax TaxID=2639665 RepID=UPI00372083ED